MDSKHMRTSREEVEMVERFEKIDEAEIVNLSKIDTTEGSNFHWTFGKILGMVAFQLGYTADLFLITGGSAILATINKDIGPSSSYVWILTSNLVANAVLSPFVGRIGDIFGRRNVLLVANVIGCVGCIVTATATNVNAAIGGGVLLGVSGSGHQVTWSCIGELVPKNQRPFVLGLYQASLSPASAFGALVAYAFVASSSWRSLYWLAFAIEATGLVMVFFFYRPINQHILEEGKTRLGQLKELDFVGLILFTSGLVLFLLGLSFGGAQFAWVSAGTIVPLLVGIVLLVACGFWEKHTTSPYALFPRQIMRRYRDFTIILGIAFLVGMIFYSTGVIWPEQIQILYTQEPIKIGLYSIATGASGAIASPIVGKIIAHVNQTRLVLVIAVGLLTLVSGLQAIVTPSSHIASTLIVCLCGAMIGSATVITNTMAQLGVEHQYIGVAMALINCSRSVGGSVATTIYVSILKNKVAALLPTYLGGALLKAGLPMAKLAAVAEALASGNLTSTALVGVSPTILEAGGYAIELVYARAFRIVYLVGITFGVLGLICSCFAVNVRHLMTDQLDMKMEEGAHVRTHADNTGGYIIKHHEIEKVVD